MPVHAAHFTSERPVCHGHSPMRVPGPDATSITNAATHTAITSARAARMSLLRGGPDLDYAGVFAARGFSGGARRASQRVLAYCDAVARDGQREGHAGDADDGEEEGKRRVFM